MDVLLTAVALVILVLFRNELVFRCRMKACDITHLNASISIDIGGDWRSHWDKYDQHGTYNQMMFDLRKWTFKQFYPDM